MLFVTHHALSRSAQRAGVRTPADIIIAAIQRIWEAVLENFAAANEVETFFRTPPHGLRLRVDDEITVVLQRHHTREALAVVTIIESKLSQADTSCC